MQPLIFSDKMNFLQCLIELIGVDCNIYTLAELGGVCNDFTHEVYISQRISDGLGRWLQVTIRSILTVLIPAIVASSSCPADASWPKSSQY